MHTCEFTSQLWGSYVCKAMTWLCAFLKSERPHCPSCQVPGLRPEMKNYSSLWKKKKKGKQWSHSATVCLLSQALCSTAMVQPLAVAQSLQTLTRVSHRQWTHAWATGTPSPVKSFRNQHMNLLKHVGVKCTMTIWLASLSRPCEPAVFLLRVELHHPLAT